MTTTPVQPPLAGAPAGPEAEPPVRKRRRHKPSIRVAALNITSFMDLTFNLLLFFILTASFSIGEGVLPADLPTGNGAGAATTTGPPKNPVFINLRTFGSMDKVVIQIEGSPATPADFDALYTILNDWRHDSQHPNGIYQADNPIVIKPDRGVLWKDVVDTFNTVVRARYSNVGFQALPAN